MRTVINLIDRYLAYLENSVIVLLVTVMVLGSFLQIVLRLAVDGGFLWGDIFLRHLVLWIGFIGASLATRDDKHISIDVLSRITPATVMPYIRIVVNLATIFVCVVLSDAAWTFVEYEIEAETILFNDVPAWIFQIIMPIGFGLIAFRLALKTLMLILSLISGEADPHADKREPVI